MRKIGIIIMLAIVAAAFAGCVDNKQSTQNSGIIDISINATPQETTDEIVSDDTTTSSQIDQETESGVTTPWYPLGDKYPAGNRDIYISKYNATVQIREGQSKGSARIEGMEDMLEASYTRDTINELWAKNKLLTIKIRYRNKQTDQTIEGKTETLALTGFLDSNWKELLNNPNRQNIEWQIDFGVKYPEIKPTPPRTVI